MASTPPLPPILHHLWTEGPLEADTKQKRRHNLFHTIEEGFVEHRRSSVHNERHGLDVATPCSMRSSSLPATVSDKQSRSAVRAKIDPVSKLVARPLPSSSRRAKSLATQVSEKFSDNIRMARCCFFVPSAEIRKRISKRAERRQQLDTTHAALYTLQSRDW